MLQRQALPISVVVVLGLVLVVSILDRSFLSAVEPVLETQLSLSNAQMQQILYAFFFAYIPAQLLSGWLVHRFQVRTILGIGVGVSAAATLLTGLAGGFVSLFLLRVMLAAGQGVIYPSWHLIAARNTVEQERGRFHGFISAGQGIAPVLLALLGGQALKHLGWRGTFLGLGGLTLLCLWPWFKSPADEVEPGPPSVSYRAILRQRDFWGAALGHFSINYAFYFLLTWLPSFLSKGKGFSVSKIAGIGAAAYGLYAVAMALSGMASDRLIAQGGSPTRVRKAFLLASAIGVTLTIVCSRYMEPPAAVWLLGAAAVFFGLSTPAMYAVTTTLAGPRAAGRWMAAQNGAGQLAGILAPLLTGFFLDGGGGPGWVVGTAAASAVLAIVAWGVIVRSVAPVQWPEEQTSFLALWTSGSSTRKMLPLYTALFPLLVTAVLFKWYPTETPTGPLVLISFGLGWLGTGFSSVRTGWLVFLLLAYPVVIGIGVLVVMATVYGIPGLKF